MLKPLAKVFCCLALVASCVLVPTSTGRGEEQTGATQRYSRSEVHMGVEFEVVLYAAGLPEAERAFAKAFGRVAELDKKLSDYDLDSELSKLSETSSARGETTSIFPAVHVSDDLWQVLSTAQELSAATSGAFDITVGPLTKLWRRARRWKELPEPDQLALARNAVGSQFLKLETTAKTVQLLRPNMRLDLGGIAKGFAAEEAAKAATSCGIRQVLVRASGDIYAADPPPHERGWKIGIAPLNPDDPPQRFVELANMAISTSGDARQHLTVDGRRYSHIIDPRNGSPVSWRSSVTVIAPHGVLADGLDTAASVLGPDHALSVIGKYPGTELFMVAVDDAGRERRIESPGFPAQ